MQFFMVMGGVLNSPCYFTTLQGLYEGQQHNPVGEICSKVENRQTDSLKLFIDPVFEGISLNFNPLGAAGYVQLGYGPIAILNE